MASRQRRLFRLVMTDLDKDLKRLWALKSGHLPPPQPPLGLGFPGPQESIDSMTTWFLPALTVEWPPTFLRSVRPAVTIKSNHQLSPVDFQFQGWGLKTLTLRTSMKFNWGFVSVVQQ